MGRRTRREGKFGFDTIFQIDDSISKDCVFKNRDLKELDRQLWVSNQLVGDSADDIHQHTYTQSLVLNCSPDSFHG